MGGCDHHSVGIIAKNGKRILIVQWREKPYGYAVPTGHLDGDIYPEEACIREFQKQTGLKVVGEPTPIQLPGERYRRNECGKEGGVYHYWTLFGVQWEGKLNPSKKETIRAEWLTIKQIKSLGERTEKYLGGEITEINWMIQPGLEPIWHEFLKELGII